MTDYMADFVTDFLTGAALLVLALVWLGLMALLRRRDLVDRMMAVQLLGTGGIGCLLLLGAASGTTAIVDVALILAVLAQFTAIAFVRAGIAGGQASQADRAAPRHDPPASAGADPGRGAP